MEPVTVQTAGAADAAELAAVAGRTFPLACPPTVSTRDIAAFIVENLSEIRFRGYLRDPDRIVLVARQAGLILGYTMLIRESPTIRSCGARCPRGRRWRCRNSMSCRNTTAAVSPPH